MPQDFRKPTLAEIRAAVGKTVADVIAPDLRVLFVGINPGLYTAAIGHHFGRPGNRFWPALYAAGFTDRLLSPYEERELLQWGYGITNLAPRATAGANDLSVDELLQGGQVLAEKVRAYRPKALAVLGISAYRIAFQQLKAALGPQPEPLGGAPVWVLPNPSGLNAHYPPDALARLFAELKQDVERSA